MKAHGTGTRPGDASELRGLARLFGARLAQMPVTSLKSAVGHALGASGAVEAVAVVLSLEDGFVPGTLGFERLDPDAPACQVNACPRDTPGGSVLLLSESFGGRAAALVLAT